MKKNFTRLFQVIKEYPRETRSVKFAYKFKCQWSWPYTSQSWKVHTNRLYKHLQVNSNINVFDLSLLKLRIYGIIPLFMPDISAKLDDDALNCCVNACTVVGWLVVLKIYVALAISKPYRELEAGHNRSLKS